MPRLKKEDEFYTLLKELSASTVSAAEDYAVLFHEYPDSASQIPQMKVHEVGCDQVVRKIMEKLYTSFITPFDREDISNLALAIDDIADCMEGVAVRLDLFNIQSMRHEADELASLTLTAVRTVQEMIEHLPDYQNDPVVMEKAELLSSIEDEGDTLYQNGLRRLFHEDNGGKQSLVWLRIFDRMEATLDSCDHVAAIVRSVVMKSA